MRWGAKADRLIAGLADLRLLSLHPDPRDENQAWVFRKVSLVVDNAVDHQVAGHFAHQKIILIDSRES